MNNLCRDEINMNLPVTRRNLIAYSLLLATAFLFVGQESRASGYQYVVPEKTQDGWETASLEDANAT